MQRDRREQARTSRETPRPDLPPVEGCGTALLAFGVGMGVFALLGKPLHHWGLSAPAAPRYYCFLWTAGGGPVAALVAAAICPGRRWPVPWAVLVCSTIGPLLWFGALGALTEGAGGVAGIVTGGIAGFLLGRAALQAAIRTQAAAGRLLIKLAAALLISVLVVSGAGVILGRKQTSEELPTVEQFITNKVLVGPVSIAWRRVEWSTWADSQGRRWIGTGTARQTGLGLEVKVSLDRPYMGLDACKSLRPRLSLTIDCPPGGRPPADLHSARSALLAVGLQPALVAALGIEALRIKGKPTPLTAAVDGVNYVVWPPTTSGGRVVIRCSDVRRG